MDEFSLLRTVIDAVPDPIFCKDRQGRYLLANRAHAERLGILHGASFGKTVFELQGITPELAQRYHEDDETVLSSGEAIINREEPFVWSDGEAGWYLTSKYPLRDAVGQVVGLVGITRNITVRRKAERKAHEEREMLRTVIDGVGDAIFFKDCAGRFLLVNAAHERIFGLSNKDVLGRTSPEVDHRAGSAEDCSRRYMADDRLVIESGMPLINREEPRVDRDGNEGWLLTSKYPLHDTEGKIVGLVGIARDITELKRATDELARTRERLIDHVENSPLGVIEWQSNFRVERWSGQAEAMFGWSSAEVVGKHFGEWEFVYPDDAPGVDEITARLLDGRDERNVSRNRNLTKDGRVVHCVWHNSVLRDAEGRIVSLLSLVEDVTERVHAEQVARESERHYRALVEATDTGYVVLDERGHVLEANAEFVRQSGHATFEEIRGRSVMEWSARHDLERNQREFERCIRTGSTRHLEIDVAWPDGRILPIEINARLLDDSGGRRVIALCRDISDRREAEVERRRVERKLQEAQKLESLGVLAGGIAHDFNNLLTSMLGNASLAGLDVSEESPAHRCLKEIETAAMRASDLCQQMLAYSGRGRFIVRRVDLNSVIHETMNLLRASISKNTTLQLDLASYLPPVQADATQLRQIVMNLVVNASEALGEKGGTVGVRTGVVHETLESLASSHHAPDVVEGDYVFIEVTDDGCGMPEEVRTRIFEPFFTTKFAGRGLGLAAVLGIVRGHSGALQVESGTGVGATFRVLLPALEGPADHQPAVAASESDWQGHGTVLVVDDEPAVRSTVTRMLHLLGFDVRLAVDGCEGVEIFRSSPHYFALVLLDLTMPRLGGESVLQIIREELPELPVVVMSGYSEAEVTARLGAGAPTAFIQKPFDLPRLRDTLRGIFE
jgi:PAS domain S-box-containing protein